MIRIPHYKDDKNPNTISEFEMSNKKTSKNTNANVFESILKVICLLLVLKQ